MISLFILAIAFFKYNYTGNDAIHALTEGEAADRIYQLKSRKSAGVDGMELEGSVKSSEKLYRTICYVCIYMQSSIQGFF